MKVDNLIVGAGIAGLWLSARAKQQGIESLVIAPELGGGQTLLSQGIVHGGTKYALSGSLTGASEAIKNMPERWTRALNGSGEVDLTRAQLNTSCQLMIHDDSLAGSVTQFFASKSLRGRVERVAPPAFLDRKRRVYELTEPVVDTASVVSALAGQVNIVPGEVVRGMDGLRLNGESIQAKRTIYCAGRANATLCPHGPKMQLRPLKMLVGQGSLPPLWAHIIGASTKPLATITTHEGVWYVGGQIAEDGAAQSDTEFLASAPERLSKLLPEIDLSQVEWSSIDVDRAEPAQASGARPDNAFVWKTETEAVVWPTKLALAPAASDELMDWLVPASNTLGPTLTLPAMAKTPWSRRDP